MGRKMTPSEAIELLDGLVAKVPLIRADHELVMEALRVLRELAKESKDG